jgi:predicted AlkP superfamily phosphohydrolase/phosphomutase
MVLVLAGCDDRREAKVSKQVIMIGFDGMDPALCRELLEAGRLPNLAKLAEMGSFLPLQTSTPPQSPVAWSSIITGTNPGEHGIFDFIHRDPDNYRPDFSTSRNEEPSWKVPLGDWVFPLRPGEVVNLRHGTPFWEFLTAAGVDAQVYRIPANYPPTESPGPGKYQTLTDMGTPDLTGSLGEFSFYTSGPWDGPTTLAGGKVHRLRIRPIGGDTARASFYGPPDTLLDPTKVGSEKANRPLEVEFVIARDKSTHTAVIEWQEERVLLKVGEWSEWQRLSFSMGPQVAGAAVQGVRGVFRMYLRRVDPIELYATPIMIDPAAPALPVSVPDDFAKEVAKELGPYFTKGLPEDTHALRHKVFTRDEFLEQADLVFQERMRLLDFALERFEHGFLFFYFGTTDQVGHMFWSAMAKSHPALTPEESEKYRDVMREIYVRSDVAVGKVLEKFPNATILCVSDHGFADFARGFNLNSWLVENGYAVLKSDKCRSGFGCFDWTKTKAYGLGINGLYINLQSRERDGIVAPADKQALMDEIKAGLLAFRDPETGAPVIKEVYQADVVYSGSQVARGPDMQIGYARGYRGSWSTALGETPEVLVEDNREAWCGDHCIATDLVPGVLFTNRPVAVENPTLEDLAPTVLAEFGIDPPAVMKGSNVFTGRRGSGN